MRRILSFDGALIYLGLGNCDAEAHLEFLAKQRPSLSGRFKTAL